MAKQGRIRRIRTIKMKVRYMKEARTRQNALWKECNKQGGALLIWKAIMNIVVIIAVVAAVVISSLGLFIDNNPDSMSNEDMLKVIEEMLPVGMDAAGWGYLAAIGVGLLILLLWKKPKYFKTICQPNKRMTGKTFFITLSFFLTCQLVAQIAFYGLEALLGLFGVSAAPIMEMANVDTSVLSMAIYAGIAAPIAEELLFRGLVLRSLEPHNKGLAIIVSSVLFGLFHGNPVQIPFAAAVGIILAYITLEYNIGWAILLHMINNLVLGVVIPEVFGFLPNGGADLIVWGIIVAAGIAAVVIAIRKRNSIRELLRSWRAEKWQWKACTTSPLMIILAVSCIADMGLMLLMLFI